LILAVLLESDELADLQLVAHQVCQGEVSTMVLLDADACVEANRSADDVSPGEIFILGQEIQGVDEVFAGA